MPTTLDDFSLVLTNYEQRSREFTSSKSGPSNFVSESSRSGNARDQKGNGKGQGSIACSVAGRDSDHDFKTRKRSIKWREKSKRKTLATTVDKREQRESKTQMKAKRSKRVRIEEPTSEVESSDLDVEESED